MKSRVLACCRRGGAVLFVVSLLSLASSCAAMRRLTASVADYEQYRTVRTAPTQTEKLGAAWQYLKNQPEGAWHMEVARWFRPAEQAYLVRGWNRIPQLEVYLRVVPDSQRSEQARARIQQLRAMQQQHAAEEAAFIEQERQRRARLDAAQQARQQFIREISGWVRLISTSGDLGKTRAEFSEEFRKAFFEDAPQASCEAEVCRKTLLYEFDIPMGQKLETRPASITIELTFSTERLTRVSIEAPELFDRISEAATLRAVVPGDLQARAEAVATAVQVLGLALHSGFSAPECEAEAISPVVLAKACAGRHAELWMGQITEDFGAEPDRVVFWVEPTE